MGTLAPQRRDLSTGIEFEMAELMHLRKFSREEFYTMVDAGIFDDDYKVELIDGRIVTEMPPIGGEHGWSVGSLNQTLIDCVRGTEYRLHVQSGIALKGDRELQPDLAIFKVLPERERKNPTQDQIVLVVEVSESSLRKDLTQKLRLYGEAEIPNYWVVDEKNRRVSVYTKPFDGAYTHLEQVAGGDTLQILGKQIAVDDVF